MTLFIGYTHHITSKGVFHCEIYCMMQIPIDGKHTNLNFGNHPAIRHFNENQTNPGVPVYAGLDCLNLTIERRDLF